ncbi:MAG TPA: tetratricopeptide repeat protein [Candidatus Marinimicrobia bacterium]|nr:tetratricopeptide repeat protein [Candidatus Neomarinimicrobiota bacterium]
MNKFINLILFTCLVFCQNHTTQDVLQQIQKRAQNLNKPKNIEIENKFAQAKTLERSGLYEEALLLYKEINRLNPGTSKYFLPLKNYLKQIESWDSLMVYTQSYSNARNNDLQSKLEFLDVYIFMEAKDKWEPLATALLLDLSISEKSIKNILQRLVGSGKLDFAYGLLTQYRKITGKQDFYSIELGSYLGMRMAYEKSVREYLLFLEFHPRQIQTISDRIMVFPDDPKINAALKEVLQESRFKSAQFILADLQFKLKEFDLAFETLIANDANHAMLLDFGKDLSQVKEYIRANRVFTYIINSSKNEQILTKTVFEIAKVFESKLVLSVSELPLSGFYPNNPFFSSPYVSVKDKSGYSLQQAMEIYDSLRVTKKNAQAAYRLAEVQFRILGDLDGAMYLYEEALIHGNSKSLRIDAGLGSVNIHIAKGDLESAEKKCADLIQKAPDVLEYQIKSAQILFYQGEFDQTDVKLHEIVEQLPMDNYSVNDILDVMAILIGFRHNQGEFVDFAKVQLNIQQNKRTEALEKLEELFDTNEIYIADMCRYQHAWLTFLQGDVILTKLQLSKIENETIFKELAHIFQAEILDFIDKDISKAIDSYLQFLELYPQSIYYDDVRLRLRELAS